MCAMDLWIIWETEIVFESKQLPADCGWSEQNPGHFRGDMQAS